MACYRICPICCAALDPGEKCDCQDDDQRRDKVVTKNGVAFYTTATVPIHFPEGNVCCDLCPLLETYARKQCRRTGEYLLDTRVTVGYECPLKFEEVENE